MSKKHTSPKEQEHNLKGTLISVFGIGIFIFISWFAAFALHLSR
ncbi:cytochrome C oxidase subunit II [Bacillus suaedaesalsae]|uniref:Cytochrome C oxidase subunit II n=1 Tax=Bacillus suaedaesalsae TaxID=2810349 RepID=A0ABS2DF20_9BACI|nr:cytochrome C oxidase subunit II [Bacillus suaedaesalsae]